MTSRTSILAPSTALALLAATGCAPDTPYRYSAVTPSAQPVAWDGRTEREGFARFEGTIAHTSVSENLLPVANQSSAMMIPEWTVQGAALLAVAYHVELGIRGNYSAYQWTQPSAVGTMPVADSPPTWGVGPEMRVSIPVDKAKTFYFGIVGNAIVAQVPYSEWTLTGPLSSLNSQSCTPSATCVVSQGAPYTLTSTQTETHIVWTLGVVPSYAFGPDGEYGHVFAGITATTGFSNDGFATTQQNGSTVNTFWPLFIASAGYAGSIDVLRLGGQVFYPFTNAGSAVDYGIGFLFTVGVAAPLWEGKHRDQG